MLLPAYLDSVDL